MATFLISPSISISHKSLSILRNSLSPNPQNPKSLSFPIQTPKTLTLTPTKPSTLNSLPTPITPSSPNPHSLKTRLKNNETLYGIFLLSFSPTLAELSGLAGYDFAVIDMEHGPGGISSALPILHALASTNTPAIIRLPESCPALAKKALDLGPQGIMFPMIESPKAAKKAVSYCKFPPAGIRGSAHTIVRASGYGTNDGYLNTYEDELLILCQVESEEGVKKIEEIASVEGVDGIQMGPLDLSASLGYLWDPGNKKVREVLRGAEKAVLGMKKKGGGGYLSGFVMPFDGADELRKRGYHMVAGAADIGLFRNAVVEDVKRFKMGFKGKGGEDDEDGDGKLPAEDKYWSE